MQHFKADGVKIWDLVNKEYVKNPKSPGQDWEAHGETDNQAELAARAAAGALNDEFRRNVTQTAVELAAGLCASGSTQTQERIVKHSFSLAEKLLLRGETYGREDGPTETH